MQQEARRAIHVARSNATHENTYNSTCNKYSNTCNTICNSKCNTSQHSNNNAAIVHETNAATHNNMCSSDTTTHVTKQQQHMCNNITCKQHSTNTQHRHATRSAFYQYTTPCHVHVYTIHSSHCMDFYQSFGWVHTCKDVVIAYECLDYMVLLQLIFLVRTDCAGNIWTVQSHYLTSSHMDGVFLHNLHNCLCRH